MNRYTFTIDFEDTFLAKDYETAVEWINKKYFMDSSEKASFVNIPIDRVSVSLTSDTKREMDIRGEDY